jgi:hypothetical protein
LFLWFSNKYKQADKSVSQHEKRALRQAYTRLPELPKGVPDDAKCLLDREGRLRSRLDVTAGRYVIDDDPELSNAIVKQELPLAFADTSDERTLRFYTSIGVASLTEIKERVDTKIGESREPPKWFNATKVFERIHVRDFPSALVTLATHEFRHTDEKIWDRFEVGKQLQSLQSISFVQELQAVYKVANTRVRVATDILLHQKGIYFSRVRSYSELYGFLAQAIAGLLVKDIMDQRTFPDAIYRLLTSESPREIQTYLKSRGIPWKPATELEEDEIESEEYIETEEARQIQKILSEGLTATPTARKEVSILSPTTASPRERSSGNQQNSSSSSTLSLPPLESVRPRLITQSSSWSPSKRQKRGATSSGAWQPPTQQDQNRDRIIGRRGEEIIYKYELERVKSLGQEETQVIWISKDNPGADYDILSVDDDGGPLWIEVKATTGKDGRFHWSSAEFKKALAERDRYVIWRVYEADTQTPPIKRFRDPITRLLRQEMRLDVANLYAEVEPLNS